MSTTTRSGKAAQAAEAKDERQRSANAAQATNRPVHEVRLGRIVGAVWRHAGDDGKAWYNVTLSRICRTAEDGWARSDSFGDLEPEAVIRDKGYDSDALAEASERHGAEVVIPPKSNRTVPRE